MAKPKKTAAPAAGDKMQPFAFGQRADGTPVMFSIWPEHGALHPLMGGATGGGKSNTLNVLTAGIVSCNDTVAKKGQAAADGSEAAHPLMTLVPALTAASTRTDLEEAV